MFVAFLVAMIITSLLLAAVLDTLSALALRIIIISVCDFRDIRLNTEDTARIIRIVDLAVLADPFRGTITSVVVDLVDARGILLAWVTFTFVPGVELAVRACRTWRAVASIAGSGNATRAAILTWLGIAVGASKLAIGTMIIARTDARVSVLFSRAYAAVLARRAVAKIHFDLTVTTHVTRLAVAMIVVDQLYTILRARRGARIRQAFVDIAFTSWSDKPWWTSTLETAHLVGTRAVVMTSTYHAIIDVDLAYEAESTGWTGTTEVVD